MVRAPLVPEPVPGELESASTPDICATTINSGTSSGPKPCAECIRHWFTSPPSSATASRLISGWTRHFNYFAALSRWAGPVQLFPANYLYPDAALGSWQRAPAPIFADILPHVGGSNFPLIDGTPDPWGKIARFEGPDYFYGYPFNATTNPVEDANFQQRVLGSTILPNGRLDAGAFFRDLRVCHPGCGTESRPQTGPRGVPGGRTAWPAALSRTTDCRFNCRWRCRRPSLLSC